MAHTPTPWKSKHISYEEFMGRVEAALPAFSFVLPERHWDSRVYSHEFPAHGIIVNLKAEPRDWVETTCKRPFTATWVGLDIKYSKMSANEILHTRLLKDGIITICSIDEEEMVVVPVLTFQDETDMIMARMALSG